MIQTTYYQTAESAVGKAGLIYSLEEPTVSSFKMHKVCNLYTVRNILHIVRNE